MNKTNITIGRVDVVIELLKYGAQKDIRDKEKSTPLALAKQLKPENYEQVISLLQ